MPTNFEKLTPLEAAAESLDRQPVTAYALQRVWTELKRHLRSQGLPLDWFVRGRHGLPSTVEPNPSDKVIH